MLFNTMLAKNSATRETLISAMVNWWMASDRDDALTQITAHPGEDLAGIENSVMAGLKTLGFLLDVEVEDLVSEAKLDALKEATAMDIVISLDAIHIQWLDDNFSAKRWAEKYFKGQLFQYRKTSKLPWSTAALDLLFIQKFLSRGGNTHTEDEIKEAFESYARIDSGDEDLEEIALHARTFAPEIISWVIAYRDKLDPKKKAQQIKEVNDFLSKHQDGAEIMEIMIKAVVGE